MSAFVPANLTTIGTLTFVIRAASTTPFATLSQRTIPPKIFIKIAFTFLSDKIILNPCATVSAFAVPPTSKNLQAFRQQV